MSWFGMISGYGSGFFLSSGILGSVWCRIRMRRESLPAKKMVNCAWVMRWVFVVQSLSHVQLCDLMDCSMPGSFDLRYLPEFAQLPVHWVSDVIQPSHPLTLLSIWPQSFPTPGSFPMNRLFASNGQIIGASASASVLPMNIQTGFSCNWLVWFPCNSRDSQESSPTSLFESINFLALSFFFMVELSHLYMTTGKTVTLAKWTFVSKVMSLHF